MNQNTSAPTVDLYLTEDAAKQLVTSCVLFRLDYCNSLLVNTVSSVIQPMQKVQNTAARLILRAPCHQNCTPLLRQLHWFPVSERIKYKTACMCYNSTIGSAPYYLSELLHFYSPSRSLRSSSDTRMIKLNASSAKPMAFGICKTSVSTSRTISHKASALLCLPSKANPKHFSSPDI